MRVRSACYAPVKLLRTRQGQLNLFTLLISTMEFQTETIEYSLPVYWSCALVYDDPSGLSDTEQRELDLFWESEIGGNIRYRRNINQTAELLGIEVLDDHHLAREEFAPYRFLLSDCCTYKVYWRYAI